MSLFCDFFTTVIICSLDPNVSVLRPTTWRAGEGGPIQPGDSAASFGGLCSKDQTHLSLLSHTPWGPRMAPGAGFPEDRSPFGARLLKGAGDPCEPHFTGSKL